MTKNSWLDNMTHIFSTRETYEGGQWISVEVTLKDMPVFVRGL